MTHECVRPFAGAPIALWIGVLLTVYLGATWQRLGGAAIPLPVRVPIVANAGASGRRIPEERVGHGLRCVDPAPGLSPYARCCEAGPCGKMSTTRRLLIGVPIDLAKATQADLEALPGIGPKLAARVLAARAELPLGASLQLNEIRGLGAHRARSLARVLGLDERVVHDICSLGSWPTTSSGCGKPP